VQQSGKFKDEIVPITIQKKKENFIFDQDEAKLRQGLGRIQI